MEKILISKDENIKSEIIIENDLRLNLEYYFENKNYFLITNETIAKLYPEIIYKFNKSRVIIIKDGEKYKNIKTFEYILNELLKAKIERKDAIVALGGGVVGDMAGYCASGILRGVELIQVPTTLLAMCDSSIGGKTGFNTKYGKNLIGSFYFAKKILIDPQFLNTLDEKQYLCGLGEIIKYALIEKSCLNKNNFDLLNYLNINQKDDVKKSLDFIIHACASLKATVVSIDGFEKDLRKILNFGHTFAHAYETISKYKKFSHGLAVAYGIKCASLLAYQKELISKEYFNNIDFLLEKFDLINPKIEKKFKKYKKDEIISLMYQDKKVENSKINLLLPTAPAQVALFDNIAQPSLEASLP